MALMIRENPRMKTYAKKKDTTGENVGELDLSPEYKSSKIQSGYFTSFSRFLKISRSGRANLGAFDTIRVLHSSFDFFVDWGGGEQFEKCTLRTKGKKSGT